MLRIAIIVPDEAVKRQLADLFPKLEGVEVVGASQEYLNVEDLLRTIRVRKVDALILSIDNPDRALSLASSLDDQLNGFPVISIGAPVSPEFTVRLMHLGVRDHLNIPVQAQALADAVDGARRRLAKHPVSKGRQSDLYTFFPAKPGVGTSTIALSTSCALAEECGARTLLLDCDLAAGAIKFLLKLGNSSSLLDALSHGQNLDEGLWAQMIAKWDQLEVLHAGSLEEPPLVDPSAVQKILAIARPQYDVICADLGSSFDPLSVEFMRESHRIFLVTTPEVVPLYLAADRMRHLSALGLDDRVSLLLNRRSKNGKPLTIEEVEKVVGIPVTHCFSNDYRHVQSSILDAKPVELATDLGQSILDLAHSLVPHLEPRKPGPRRKFLEFFHVAPAAASDAAWHD